MDQATIKHEPYHPVERFQFLSACAPVTREMMYKKITVGKNPVFSQSTLDFDTVLTSFSVMEGFQTSLDYAMIEECKKWVSKL